MSGLSKKALKAVFAVVALAHMAAIGARRVLRRAA